MGKKGRETLPYNLPQLQNLIKRDPSSYKDEFRQQYARLQACLQLFNGASTTQADHQTLAELVNFVGHVAPCFPAECQSFPQDLVDLLSAHSQTMDPDLRKTLVQVLILLRNRNLIPSAALLSLCFTLFSVKDKQLRSLLHSHIVNDIKSQNAKGKNNKLNKALQNFMYTMLKDPSDIAARKSLEAMIDLYKKNIWNDAKTVNIIAEACLSPSPKIVATAVNFFLSVNERPDDSDDDEATETVDVNSLKHTLHVSKKKRSQKARMGRALATVKRKQRARNRAENYNFSAIHLLNDPQGFAEKMYSRLKLATNTSALRFELRLQILDLITRLVGIHKLILLPLYDFFVPYLRPQQREVTKILAFAAQASHDLVPPEAGQLLVESIANHFVWNNVASEVVVAGLNALREICSRCPLAMGETLLRSLIDDYKNHRDKGPTMAARSLIALYREMNPELLKKKDRGKSASMALREEKKGGLAAPKLVYGQVKVAKDVEGIELLEEDQDIPPGDDDDFDGWIDEPDNSDGEEAPLLETEDAGDIDVDEIDFDNGEWEIEEMDASDSGEGDDSSNQSDPGDAAENGSDAKSEGDKNEAVADSKSTKMPLAAQKVLTEEDFARIRALRNQRDVEKLTGAGGPKRKRGAEELEGEDSEDENEITDVVNESVITAGIKRKADYEARIASIQAGREGREKFGSKRNKTERSSLTNKVKAKNSKAFMMMIHKRDVKNKAKRSLKEKRRVLTNHVKHAVTIPLRPAPYVNLSAFNTRGSGMSRYQTTASGGQMPAMGGSIKTCYLINLSIQGKTFNVEVDSGSSNLIIPTAGLAGYTSGPDAPTYNTTGKATLQSGSVSQSFAEGSSWTGYIYSDTVTLSGTSISASAPLIGVTSQTQNPKVMSGGTGSTGLWGIAYRSLSSYTTASSSTPATVFEALVAQNPSAIQNNIAFRACPYPYAGSSAMDIGATNNQLTCSTTGVVGYARIPQEAWYTVQVLGIAVNGKFTFLPSGFQTSNAYGQWSIVDTCTSLLYLTNAAWMTLANAVLNSNAIPGLTSYGTDESNPFFHYQMGIRASAGSNINWGALPSLTIDMVMNQSTVVTLTIFGHQYIQLDPVNGYVFTVLPQSSSVNYINLGAAFLNSYYVVFDRDNAQIGFAPGCGCDRANASHPAAFVGVREVSSLAYENGTGTLPFDFYSNNNTLPSSASPRNSITSMSWVVLLMFIITALVN
ncbi:hypothetical protein SeMB42_g01473 [Synchytrium endobioticum]|uniref:Peptidase A1 domain-containing protein n=1 Tax=Synchytrium endobioticum TaxID=286115 RepID=A0A507DL35_9FUNG|nr:hypothetical protein SeLEV6574_g01200 [Synchytrium endobioticum]TPX52364.1 hypothetical protein SeMB42_g01473 [Synchytrium endobioticum]